MPDDKTITRSIKKSVARLYMIIREWLLGYSMRNDYELNRRVVEAVWADFKRDIESDDEFTRLASRSLAQFKSQCRERTAISQITVEILSFFALPFLVGFWAVSAALTRPQEKREVDGVQVVSVLDNEGKPHAVHSIPEALGRDIIGPYRSGPRYLRRPDIALLTRLFIFGFRRSPFPFFQFIVKVAKEFAYFGPIRDRFAASYAIVYREYDCTSSLLKLFLNLHGIKLYNVMHGDKCFHSHDAFFEFDRCYCWNQFYVDIFAALHAKADFRIFTPPNFIPLDDADKKDGVSVGFIVPTLPHLPHLELGLQRAFDKVWSTVFELSKKIEVVARVHPFQVTLFQKYFENLPPGVTMCDPREIPPRLFLSQHPIILGTYSTMLIEAAMQGCEVVVVETETAKALYSYHFLFQQPNVTVCQLDEVRETIQNLKEKIEVQQKVVTI